MVQRNRKRATDRVGADPRLVDGLLALGVASALSVAIAADLDGTGRATPGAYLFAAGFGALLLARRKYPRLVLVATVLGVFAYYTSDFAAMGIALPAVAALYSAAEAGATRFALVSGVVLAGTAAAFQIMDGLPANYLVSYELLTNLALIVAAIALGAGVRSRRQARDHQVRLRAVTAAEHAMAAEQRVHEERMRMARDLHDSVGHTMSVIAVHTNVAAEALGRDDAAVQGALDKIHDATAATMRELRSTVKVLRSPAGDLERGTVGLRGLEDLAVQAREAGLEVVLDAAVGDGVLDGAIDAAAYRIVQESLTNVLRHASASRATVSASVEDGTLRLSVADDGRGARGTATGQGTGLAGMRERVSLLRGRFRASDAPGGGFVVTAELPARLG